VFLTALSLIVGIFWTADNLAGDLYQVIAGLRFRQHDSNPARGSPGPLVLRFRDPRCTVFLDEGSVPSETLEAVGRALELDGIDHLIHKQTGSPYVRLHEVYIVHSKGSRRGAPMNVANVVWIRNEGLLVLSCSGSEVDFRLWELEEEARRAGEEAIPVSTLWVYRVMTGIASAFVVALG
jgi:hypothetical protein